LIYILGPKCGAKSVPSFWQKFDEILPRNHINVHPILGASTLYTGAIFHSMGQNWGQNWGQKVSLSFGKNLMGFYQEIISTFILYWVSLLYTVLLYSTLYYSMPWATLGNIWATLGVLGLPRATLAYIGHPWASLGYLGLPDYLYWVSHQHCPST
jgi:hypothetical protein